MGISKLSFSSRIILAITVSCPGTNTKINFCLHKKYHKTFKSSKTSYTGLNKYTTEQAECVPARRG